MKLPPIEQPHNYRGLYVYDFGTWAALGYTAEEIAVLLESEAYCSGKVYKIVRAGPDGQLELRGVSPARFQVESGLFFNRGDEAVARGDYAALLAWSGAQPPPCRALAQLADRGRPAGASRYVTALIYPAEYEDELASWLVAGAYRGGDTVEGGVSHVSNYLAQTKVILERQQLWSRSTIPSRSATDVLNSVRRAVQR